MYEYKLNVLVIISRCSGFGKNLNYDDTINQISYQKSRNSVKQTIIIIKRLKN